MSDRLSSADVAFLYVEGRTTPQHVGGVAVFAAPDGFDYDRLIRLLQERISLAPRYRQKLRRVPANLANPVWVDDPHFDITYHVRRSALPRPGTEAALLEFCARIQSRLLDRDRPLWEMYLVEGLSGGRVAIVTKTHPSMVDGHDGIDITQVLLDEAPQPRRTVEALWMPAPEPSATRLAIEALHGAVHRPTALADAVLMSGRDARSTLASAAGAATGVAAGVATAVGGALTGLVRPVHHSPLRARLGQHRRIAVERAALADFRTVRERCGGTVNDAVLAVVTGALRQWLLGRGETLGDAEVVRALVPVGMSGDGTAGWTKASSVRGLLVDLPVGKADPLQRLTAVQHAISDRTTGSRPVSADALISLSGFAPPTLHSLGARAAHGLTRRMYALTVTNVPGPQQPLYAAGAQMTEMFPILPLNQGQALSIAVTSYNGGMYFGVNADRDAVPDISAVASSLGGALAELLAASAPPADIASGRRSRRAGRDGR